MEIRYYELSYEDIEQVSAMEKEFFSVAWSKESIAHYVEAGNTIFIVARNYEEKTESAYQVAGYAALLCAADEGNLVSIGVDRKYREMKIATQLLDILYEMAAKRGVNKIFLEVRESNIPAIRLYEKEGFALTGKRPGFYKEPPEGALLYLKKI